MAPTVEEVTTKTEVMEVAPNSKVSSKAPESVVKTGNDLNENATEDKMMAENEPTEAKVDEKTILEGKPTDDNEGKKDIVKEQVEKEEEVGVEVEHKTGVSFPVKLKDGKRLNAVGMRKKTVLGLGVKIYGFGMYADNEKLKELLKLKIGKAPAKPSKEIYEAVIDGDVEMMVRLVIVFGSLTMNMVKKNFNEGLGSSIKKLNGGRKNDDLSNKVMGAASDNISLNSGSVIEITKRPGYVLQTKVKDEVVSTVESELLCRAFIHLYLGDDPFDKEAKERFGVSALSLF